MNGFLACFLATRSGIITSASSQQPSDSRFILQQNAPLPRTTSNVAIRSFGGRLESRTLSAQDHLTSELLRTL